MEKKTILLNNKGMTRDISISKANNDFAYENFNIRIIPMDKDTLLTVTNERGNERQNLKERNIKNNEKITIEITSEEIREALLEPVSLIAESVHAVLEKTPPELASDIVEKGIVLAGGGALIRNLDKLLSQKTEMPVYIAEDPLECVVKGTGKTLEDLERLKTVLINARKRR